MNKDINIWLQQINTLNEQVSRQTIIRPEQRLDIMLLLRSPFGAEGWLAPSELPLSDYPVELIEKFLNIANFINDWPIITACCQAHSIFSLDEQHKYQQHLQSQSNCELKGADVLSSDTLTLTPMQSTHMTDFFWQYSEDIAYFCKLPEFNSEYKTLEWLDWLIDCQQQPTAHLLAIHHADWGFVGSVCFDICNGRGFFYYWIGESFRAVGIGSQAVQLVLNWATEFLNMHCCYAVVFESNTPSQKALKKLDFHPAALKVDDGDDQFEGDEVYEQELVFYKGPAKTNDEMMIDFNQLFVDIGSVLSVIPLRH